MLKPHIVSELIDVIRVPLLILLAQNKSAPAGAVLAAGTMREFFLFPVQQVEFVAAELNLRVTQMEAAQFLEGIDYAISLESLNTRIAHLISSIRNEMQGTRFLYLDHNAAGLYDAPAHELCDFFPSSAYDLEQAAKAISVHLGTAAVFHSMRVVQNVLNALWRSTGSSGTPPENWGAVISEVKRHVDQADWDVERETFYRESLIVLHSVKEVWRNPSTHEIDAKYTEGEAKQIFASVIRLAKYVGQRLDEHGMYTPPKP
jgi:HEPN domain-containing protein